VDKRNECVTDRQEATGVEETFAWHPTYAGKSVAEVRSIVTEDIARDQRAYALAMEGAEHAEGASLTTIVELERRWSPYDFDWAEMDASTLAGRIVAFEQDRENRQEMIPFAEHRSTRGVSETDSVVALSSAQSLPIMKIGAGILILLIVVFLIAIIL
jgi:hypothetical protein